MSVALVLLILFAICILAVLSPFLRIANRLEERVVRIRDREFRVTQDELVLAVCMGVTIAGMASPGALQRLSVPFILLVEIAYFLMFVQANKYPSESFTLAILAIILTVSFLLYLMRPG